MKTSVLEFKLFDDLFCLNTDEIDYVFELEEYTPLKAFHPSVMGIVRYNKDVMILIDTATLYSDKSLNMDTPKSVIVIKDNENSHYGLLVDEIIKIEDVEVAISGVKLPSKETTINHYKAKDIIINEIDPYPLLKKYNIPAMSKVKKEENKEEEKDTKDTQNDYLLFEIGENLYALESHCVKEVIEKESQIFPLSENEKKMRGAIAIRDEIIKIADIDSPRNSNDIVVVEIGEKNFGIEVDEIKDIESFTKSKLEYVESEDYYIKAFYNYKKRVVAIINPKYYIKESLTNEKKVANSNSETEKSSFLIFTIQDLRFAISMESVRRVSQTDTLPKTKSSSIVVGKNTKFITTWNKNALSLLTLENILNLKTKDTDTQAIFVEYENKIVAFIVDEIDDIVLINKKDINRSVDDSEKLINGAIIYNDKAIPTINEKSLMTME